MHIVSQMFKLEEGGKNADDSFETDVEGLDGDQATDNQSQLLSVNESAHQKSRPPSKQSHQRAKSRDAPNVSPYVKYARFTFHEKKGADSGSGL